MKKDIKRILLIIVGIIIAYNVIMFINFNVFYKKLNTYYSPNKQFSVATYAKQNVFLDDGDFIIKYNSSFNTISYIDAGNYFDIIVYPVNVEWEDSKAYVHYAHNKCIIFDLHKKPSKIDDLQEYYVTQIDTDNEEEKIQILYDYKGNEIHRTTADEIEIIYDKKSGKVKYYADNWCDSDGVYSVLYTIDGKKLNIPFNNSILSAFNNYIVFQNDESKACIYEINNDDFSSKNIVYDDIQVIGPYFFASEYVGYESNSSKLDIYDEKLNKIKTVDSYVFDKKINHFSSYYKLKYKKENVIKYNLLDPHFNVVFEYPVNELNLEEYGNNPFNNPYTFETDYSYIILDFMNNEIKSEKIKDGYDINNFKKSYLLDENIGSINVDLGNRQLIENSDDYSFFKEDKKIIIYDHNLKIVKEIRENYTKFTYKIKRYEIKNKVYYFVFAGLNLYSTYIDIYDEKFNLVLGNITYLSIYKDDGKFLYDNDTFLDYMLVANKKDEVYAVYNSNFEKVYEFENPGECIIFNLDIRKYYCIEYKDKDGILKYDIYQIVNNDFKLVLGDIEGIVLFYNTCLIKKDGKLNFCDFRLHMDEVDISNSKIESFVNEKYDSNKYYILTNSQNKFGLISKLNGKIIANCIYDTIVLYDTYFVATLNYKQTIFSYTGDMIFENDIYDSSIHRKSY